MRLRPPRRTDAAPLFAQIFQTGVTDTLLWDGPPSADALADALEARIEPTEGRRFYVIEVGGLPVGCCDLRTEGGEVSLGLWLGKEHQGRGIGTSVVRRLSDIAFAELDADAVHAAVFVGNVASRRVFEKVGFRFLRTLERAALKRGAWVDEWLFRLDRPPTARER